jgi:hypothetical protein
MILELVLGGLAIAGSAYAIGKYNGTNVALLAIKAEVVKLEASAKTEEVKLAADVKALLAKIGL